MKIILESIKNLNVSILTEAQQMQIKGGTAITNTSGDKRTPRPGSGTTSIIVSTKK